MNVSSNSASSLAFAVSASSSSRFTWSILFRTSTFFWRTCDRPRSIFSTSPPMSALTINQQCDQISVLGTTPGGRHHGLIQLAARLENTRRINKDNLGIVMDGDTANDCPCRLHLVGDNRNLGSHQLVHQCGLAGIGCADQGDKTRTLRGADVCCSCIGRLVRAGILRIIRLGHASPSCQTCSRISMALAAFCSAARFERPLPLVSSCPLT